MGFYELAEKALGLERNGKKLVRLNVGDTNMPAPKCAVRAAVAALKKAGTGYGSAAGLQELRERIAAREGCDAGEVVIGPGSKQVIFALLSVLCGRDGTVAYPTPNWPAYELGARQLGLRISAVRTLPGDSWRLPDPLPEEVRDAGVLILCNPLNPASTVYEPDAVSSAIGQATELRGQKGGYVILDEAYKGLAFSAIPRYDGENVIRVRSFSKEFSMEGWRLGYAVAPADVVKKVVAFNQATITCVPEFVQRAGIACLEDEGIVAGHREVWRARSLAAQRALRAAGFSFAKPGAGIYVFATHEKLRDADGFAMKLLEKEGVVVAPGSDFGGYGRFVRICVNQPAAVLEDAIARMGKTLA